MRFADSSASDYIITPVEAGREWLCVSRQLRPQVAAAKLRVTELPVRLIYNDPTRHFGGSLDDAGNRLRHYLDVLSIEINRLAESAVQTTLPAAEPCARLCE